MQVISAEQANGQAVDRAPERSLLVASLLSAAGGFLDAYSWLSFDGVFANSQTGNVVLLGMHAALGNWGKAAHHVPPIAAFLVGAWVALRVRALLPCLAAATATLAIAALLSPFAPPNLVTIAIISFGVALQSASFRNVGRQKYLSVTVTGNMLRAIEQVVSTSPDAVLGARTMATICLMFLLGAAAAGLLTSRLTENSLLLPIGLQTVALCYCLRNRDRRRI